MRVLITGGASGLGAALVAACAARGDALTVIDRAPPPAGFAGTWHRADLARAEALDSLSPTLAGPFDLAILNAGISATGRFENIPEDRALAVIAVNLTAPLVLSAHLIATGALARGGRLVFTGSISTFTGYPGAAVYAGTKDGLVSLARSLRGPLWRAGRIRVQVVAPGPMDTPHAALHAPPGATARGRIDPAQVAAHVLAGRGGLVSVPGWSARGLALLGRLVPTLTTGLMRRAIYVRFTDLPARDAPQHPEPTPEPRP